jgi:hypothetical protein
LCVRRLAGALLLLVAAIGVAIGGLWALMKANDAEVDICRGSECTSGWYYAVPILVGAVVLGVIGVALLLGERKGSRSGERLT